jgi:1,4-dihydroxy-2-naphthoate octaprenyltransferase
MTTLSLWLMAIRPKTLPACAGPVLVGTAPALAHDSFRFLPALAALLASLLFQIGVNFANDYFDARRGVDTEDRLGPTRVTQSGLIPPEQVWTATRVCLGLAGLFVLVLVMYGGWPILALGVAGILAALAYSGGPYPLASHGLADYAVFFFFGPAAVGGSYYVQAGDMSLPVLAASVPVGLLITAILQVNNYRDMDTDTRADKRTMAVRLGRKWSVRYYAGLLGGSYILPVLLWLDGPLSAAAALLPLLSLPLALRCVREMHTVTGSPLNDTLAKTARLSFLFSTLFAAGILL